MTGLSISTFRRWDKENYFTPCFKTKGGHRRYNIIRLEKDILGIIREKKDRKAVCYARVSTHSQKLDLKRQEKKLKNYCKDNKLDYELISDLGSGLNYKKRGLNKLINLIITGQTSKLILNHRDRLLRFGAPLLFKLCSHFGTEVIILEEQKQVTFEQELVADVIELMVVFTAKMYGRRSHQNKKVCKI